MNVVEKIDRAFRKGVEAKDYRIDCLRPQYPTTMLGRLLDVSEAGYDAWRQLPPPLESPLLATEIRLAHEPTRQTHGPEQPQVELAVHGTHGH